MKDVNRDPVRWERSMTQDKEGQYVAFHDYALLLDAHDTLRARLSEAQARIERLREDVHTAWSAERECRERLAASQRAVDAAIDFAGTVAPGASWWDDVWPEHEAALADPVAPAAQAMCGCGDTFGEGSVCANCLCGKYVEAGHAVADDVARDAVCVGRARFPRTGGNVGISWYVEDALGETNGHRSGAPKDGELLFVLSDAQAQKKEGS